MTKLQESSGTDVIGFVLVPDFPMLAFSAAVEPLRIANWITGRELYAWRVFSKDGAPVRASNGCLVTPQGGFSDIERFSVMLVCAGVGGVYFRDKQVFALLRTLARNATCLGGIGTAAYILARAGLLAGHRCTIHWEDIETFRPEFPELEVTSSLYEMDRNRMTCSGGTAALDMMLDLIAARHGSMLAGEIADQFMQRRPREGADDQRMSLDRRTGIEDARLLAAIATMEARLEDPAPLAEITSKAGVSLRHLQRLSRQHLGQSLTDFYRSLRLRHARTMLLHGSDSILEVAIASGFVSSSHFSRRYRELFGITPKDERLKQRDARRLTARPRAVHQSTA